MVARQETETSEQHMFFRNLTVLKFWLDLTSFQQILFATCFDSDVLADLRKFDGKAIKVQLTGSDLIYRYRRLSFQFAENAFMKLLLSVFCTGRQSSEFVS